MLTARTVLLLAGLLTLSQHSHAGKAPAGALLPWPGHSSTSWGAGRDGGCSWGWVALAELLQGWVITWSTLLPHEGPWGSSWQHLQSLGGAVSISPVLRAGLPQSQPHLCLFVFCSPLHPGRVLLRLRQGRPAAGHPPGLQLHHQGMLFPSNCVSPGSLPAAVLPPGLPRAQFICSLWGQDRDWSV